MATRPVIPVTLIGFGAIGRALVTRLMGHASIHITHVVVRATNVQETQAALDALMAPAAGTNASTNTNTPGTAILAVAQVPATATLALECAGHSALTTHVVGALQRGCECAVLSVGALADPGLPEQLEAAARKGGTQVHLLSGAIGGIEALSAAKLAGLTHVTYTGRKPPSAWALQGAPAESIEQNQTIVDTKKAQSAITSEAIILQASAREAARLYPKNANVAATVALAGLGLDATQVRLIADPNVSVNVHVIYAQGAFGEMRLEMRGKPLAENPKTSALAVLSALRFLHNRAHPVTI